MEYKKIILFGDIHSCYEPLKDYFDKNKFNDEYFYIFCGDLFTRGIQTKEVIDFLHTIHKKQNVVFVMGNHDLYLYKLYNSGEKYNKDAPFLPRAEVDMLYSLDKMYMDKMYDIILQCKNKFYFTFDNKNVIVTHGGTPCIPNFTIPTMQLIKGVGEYSESEMVDETFSKNPLNQNCYSIHGHRNINDVPIQNGRTFNLEGKVELGGYLRIVELTKDGFNPLYIKNDVYEKKN